MKTEYFITFDKKRSYKVCKKFAYTRFFTKIGIKEVKIDKATMSLIKDKGNLITCNQWEYLTIS
jgi:hypothetical protein